MTSDGKNITLIAGATGGLGTTGGPGSGKSIAMQP